MDLESQLRELQRIARAAEQANDAELLSEVIEELHFLLWELEIMMIGGEGEN